MQAFKWSLSLVIIAIVLPTAFAAPSIRVKRQDVQELGEPSDALDELNPIEVEVSDTNGLDREKRKLPETFEAKNAILGFVFGQVDNVIDTKTRILDRLEQANIEKNRQYNITLPPPIKDFQGLVTAVVSPKLTAITSKLTGITAGIFGGANNNGDSPAAQGLGQIVTKFLRFSGPIFQGSAGNPPTKEDPESDEAGY